MPRIDDAGPRMLRSAVAWHANGNGNGNGNGRLTREVADRIVAFLLAGNYDHQACIAARVQPETFYRWLSRGQDAKSGIHRDFYERVLEAQALAECNAVAAMSRAWDKDWRAAEGFLKRRFPERWSQTERVEVGVRVSASLSFEDRYGLSLDQVRELGRQLAQVESNRLPPPPPHAEDEE